MEDDLPNTDVAKPTDREPDIMNPLVKKTYETLPPFVYEKTTLKEF